MTFVKSDAILFCVDGTQKQPKTKQERVMKAKRYYPQTKWIKSSNGNSYVCPLNVDPNSSEEELERRCVNESENPQNS